MKLKSKPIIVKIKKLENYFDKNPLPKYTTPGAAGMDLYSSEDYILEGNGVLLISTGIAIELPEGYEAQIRPRSGLALKKRITVLNSPGTIDHDYRGEIGVILINFGKDFFVINKGDRIAQMIINKYETVEWNEVKELDGTDRGDGGFGHTGVK